MMGLTGLGGEGGSTDVPFCIALAVCLNSSEAGRGKGERKKWLVKNARGKYEEGKEKESR